MDNTHTHTDARTERSVVCCARLGGNERRPNGAESCAAGEYAGTGIGPSLGRWLVWGAENCADPRENLIGDLGANALPCPRCGIQQGCDCCPDCGAPPRDRCQCAELGEFAPAHDDGARRWL